MPHLDRGVITEVIDQRSLDVGKGRGREVHLIVRVNRDTTHVDKPLRGLEDQSVGHPVPVDRARKALRQRTEVIIDIADAPDPIGGISPILHRFGERQSV